MIRDLVFLSPLHPTLGATERRNLGTDVLAPISFLPWWDDAAQCQAFDLIRGMIEILVPFTWVTITRRGVKALQNEIGALKQIVARVEKPSRTPAVSGKR